jgi:hypothetical protein
MFFQFNKTISCPLAPSLFSKKEHHPFPYFATDRNTCLLYSTRIIIKWLIHGVARCEMCSWAILVCVEACLNQRLMFYYWQIEMTLCERGGAVHAH